MHPQPRKMRICGGTEIFKALDGVVAGASKANILL